MKRKPLSSVSLDRCAYAAGYAAVSGWDDEEPPRVIKRPRASASTSSSLWRLALMLVFVVA